MLRPSSISNLQSALGTGVQRPYRYYMIFDIPPKLGGPGNEHTFVPVLAERVPLPSKQIETIQWRHNGKTRNMPIYASYTPIQMTFICDEGMKIPKLMSAWQSLVCESGKNYMGYYIDYAGGSCRIMSLDGIGLPTYAVQLNEFWPSRVDEVRFEAKGTGYATIEVEFQYRDFWNLDTIQSMSRSPIDIFGGLRIDPTAYINSLGLSPEVLGPISNQANQILNNLSSGYNFLNINLITDLFAGTVSSILDQTTARKMFTER
jgi:hypothetical protein